MICKLIQSNKHIPLHPLGGCNKYKKKALIEYISDEEEHVGGDNKLGGLKESCLAGG